MPSTSDDVIAWMHNYHGSDFNHDTTATAYLREKGYKLTPGWCWIPPSGLTYETMSNEDYMHIKYLIEEWDYGGIAAQ